MRILAITLLEFQERAREIAGSSADVLVATGGGILVWPRARYDLVMIWLHPAADGQAWTDGEGRVVLNAAEVQAAAPMCGAVVFLGACYGVENDPMIEALFEAGARAVIAGPGENFGGVDGLAGADIMASMFRRALALGAPLEMAWMIARAVARIAGLRGAVGVVDALEYQLLGKRDQAEVEQVAGADVRGCWGRVILAVGLVIAAVVLLLGDMARDLITFDSPISPISTSTPAVTYTAWYTPDGWGQQETGFATPTPCLDCDPTPGARITYDVFLPLVACDYTAVEWSLLLEIDGETVDRSATATIGMTSTITATNQIIHHAVGVATHTLVIETSNLTMTGYSAGTGSVVTDTGALTWTMSSLSPNTLAELETYYTPITTTAYLTATLSGTEKEVEFSD